MVGRSVENEIKIRAAIKTRALLSRGSTDIYADIRTVYVSNSMSFSTVCRQVRDFSAGIGSVTSAPKYCRSKSASSPKIVIKIIYTETIKLCPLYVYFCQFQMDKRISFKFLPYKL